MAQDELFAEHASLELPELRYGPVRVSVGVIEAVLRPASIVEARRVGEVLVSARLKEPLYETADGERLVVTARRNIARPADADGVLLKKEGNKLSWLHHRLTEELESEAENSGWPAVVRKRAKSNWEHADATDARQVVRCDD